ncbi:MAG: ParB/RepB/Spo0J family partition protein [Clostridia bacterium]|nr:ParB/RepB/Spo0J family partition protein [Clostridia bacterium]MBR4956001.1 ParB/RepB/Spo0J family partition protein [Clostridia bacterium]MBR5902882.1 ParB/RepB/Spo0J family partition protein [Clostridia bacterium]
MTTGKGLGKGLNAIFRDESAAEESVKGLRLSDVEPNKDQPRHEFDAEKLSDLAESIKQHGVITPITVRRTGDTYQIIAGERRWRAARMAGLSEIPAIVLEADEKKTYELALIENLQREDLNPIEEAEGYFTLIERMGLTQSEASERIGRSRSAIANSIRLLALPEEIKEMLSAGELTAGHARALLPLESEKKIKEAAAQVVLKELSVRETEELVKNLLKEPKEATKKNDMAAIYIKKLEQDMSSSTGHRISIKHGAKKGKLTIEYYGNEDLEKVCEALKNIK